MRKVTPPDDEAFARRSVDLLRDRDFAAIEKELDPSIDDEQTPGRLAYMASLYPVGDPISLKVVGFQFVQTDETRRTNVALEYEFADKWLLAQVSTLESDGKKSVTAFQIKPLSDSLEHENRFTLAGKSSEHYAMLLMIVADLTATAVAFVLCLKAKLGRRKWIWLIVCCLGFGRLAFNWTTGEIGFNLIWIALPPVGAHAQLYGPWIVYAAVPLGAILFLLFGRDLNPHTSQPELPHPAEL